MSRPSRPGTPDFERARQETIRYHEEFYATTPLGAEGTWLARPHRLVYDALALMPDDRPVVAYDLGAGVGRHTIPLMSALPEGSEVHAIDLLESAVQRLRALSSASGAAVVHARQADLAELEFSGPVDLVFAFSAIEHLADAEAISRLLRKARSALRPRGVVALGIVADRSEIDGAGFRRPALIESGLTSNDVEELLSGTFPGFDVISRTARPAHVVERRDAEDYTLSSTLVTWIGVKPDPSDDR
ncbi:MAG TPA: class I SAM-dependent methyltransferase [Microbacterium sp.]|nr:class I SAM-dependent methyltransferase [Microbacterium sp.]